MFIKLFLINCIVVFISFQNIYPQGVSINNSGTAADTSAILDVSSTTKGVLVARMTSSQRAAIVLPANGLIVYQVDGAAGFYYNTGTPASPSWVLLIGGGATLTGDLTGSILSPYISNSGTTGNNIITAVNNAATSGTISNTRLDNTVTKSGNTFNTANNLVKLDGSGKLPAVDGSQITLSPNVTQSGNTFNTANNLIKLDGSGRLPAVDGSQLTNMPSASVADNSITNAKINTNAAIAGTKINPDFGSQNITTTGTLTLNTTTQGILIPRLSQAQKNSIVSPANGLLVYQSDNVEGIYSYDLSSASWLIAGASINYGIRDGSTASSFDLTDKTVNMFLINVNGRSLSNSTPLTYQIPSANSFSPGTSIRICLVGIGSGTCPQYIKSGAGDTYYSNNSNGGDLSPSGTGVNVGNVTSITILTDGVSKWYKVQ